MNEDTVLSKKLLDIEEWKKHYLARRVESSDREMVEGACLKSKGGGGAGVRSRGRHTS